MNIRSICRCCRERTQLFGVPAATAAASLLVLANVAIGDAAQPHDHAKQNEIADATDPHAHHRHMMESQNYGRSVHSYALPDLSVVDMNGKMTSLAEALDQDRPLMLNFMFTTCTTICPVLSATFSQVQQQLGEERDHVRLISITIDPEHDTPERLHAYAARFGAGPQWQFLTGGLQDIIAIQKAFDAYRGTKANHEPVTFLRAAPNTPWVRLEGLASASDVINEYRKLGSD